MSKFHIENFGNRKRAVGYTSDLGLFLGSIFTIIYFLNNDFIYTDIGFFTISIFFYIVTIIFVNDINLKYLNALFLIISIFSTYSLFGLSINDIFSSYDLKIMLFQLFNLINFILIWIKFGRINFTIFIGISLFMIFWIAWGIMHLEQIQFGQNISNALMVYVTLPFVMLITKNKIIHLILISILITYVALIGSRSVLIALFWAFLTLAFWDFIIKNKLRYVLFVLASFLTIIAIFSVEMVSFLSANLLIDPSSDSSFEVLNKEWGTRAPIWVQLIIYINESPVFGHGFLSSSDILSFEIIPGIKFYREYLNAHSLYLEILLRFGIIGMIFYIIFLIIIFYSVWKSRYSYVTSIFASFFSGLVVFGVTANYPFLNDVPSFSLLAIIIFSIAFGERFFILRKKKNNQYPIPF